MFVGNNDKLVQSWFVEAATRPWFPGVQRLQIIDGGTHLGCLLPSAADVWDRKIGAEQRRTYQADIAARIAEGMGWNPKSDTENDKGDLAQRASWMGKDSARVSPTSNLEHDPWIRHIEDTKAQREADWNAEVKRKEAEEQLEKRRHEKLGLSVAQIERMKMSVTERERAELMGETRL